MKTVTLKQLRDYRACGSETTPYSGRYQHLVVSLGPDWKDYQPIPLTKILEINGIDDCFWAFRCLDDDSDLKMVAIKFAVFCAYAAAEAAEAAEVATGHAATKAAKAAKAAIRYAAKLAADAEAAKAKQITKLKRLLEEL